MCKEVHSDFFNEVHSDFLNEVHSDFLNEVHSDLLLVQCVFIEKDNSIYRNMCFGYFLIDNPKDKFIFSSVPLSIEFYVFLLRTDFDFVKSDRS